VTDPVQLSFVIPAYRSAPFIEDSLTRLDRWLADSPWQPYEVIVVEDGSNDSTPQRLQARFPSVRLIQHEHNRGKGAAVRTGMLAARGRYRFFIDADVPYDLAAVGDMMRYLEIKEFDVAIGHRNIENVRQAEGRPTLVRRAASRLFTELVSRIVVTGVRDTQCGFKGFRAQAAETLFRDSTIDGFAFDVEVLYYAFKRDLDVKRVPVRLISSDHSTVSLARHGLPMLWDVVTIPFRYHFGGGARRVASPEPDAQ
jgi:dolichyl-phosphate beta-glucosyltransferase